MKTPRKIFYCCLRNHFLMYSLFGTVNTINTALFSSLLALVIGDHAASYIGYVLSLSVGYMLNAKFNFRHKLSFKEYLRFLAAYIPNYMIYIVLTTIAIGGWGWHPFPATVAASVLGVPITFLLMKFFTFSNKKNEK